MNTIVPPISTPAPIVSALSPKGNHGNVIKRDGDMVTTPVLSIRNRSGAA
jgi:hypothetical protein